MSGLGHSRQLELIAFAGRAPSAHNCQPARFRFHEDGTVTVFEDLRRRLPVADPEGRDSLIGVGAAVEGLSLALGDAGLSLDPIVTEPRTQAGAEGMLRPAFRGTICEGGRSDALARFVMTRHTYRARFGPVPAPELGALRDELPADSVVWIDQANDIRDVAVLQDRCSHEFMSRPDYQEEVYHWTRFSPRDRRWERDGLTSDCLALPRWQWRIAGALFQPAVFRLLDRAGIAGSLISERSQTRSASAVVILHRPRDEQPIETGRLFYRLWLAISAGGLAACPMSALGDSPRGAAALRDRFGIPDDRAVVNVFRVGRARPGEVHISRRLPAAELLV